MNLNELEMVGNNLLSWTFTTHDMRTCTVKLEMAPLSDHIMSHASDSIPYSSQQCKTGYIDIQSLIIFALDLKKMTRTCPVKLA